MPRLATAIGVLALLATALSPAAHGDGPRGRKLDVGGLRLYIECQGRGHPTVVLESGLGDRHEVWFGVQRRIGAHARVCSYDRAGIGFSDDRRGRRAPTTERVVDGLHTLLRRARVPGPYVIVGHSVGGFHALVFAARHPADVAGLVFVDASPPAFLKRLGTTAGRREVLDFRTAVDAVRDTQFGDKPVVALNSGLAASAREYARRSTNSSVVIARGSGHYIQEDRPRLLVEAVRQVVVAARSRTRLGECPATRFPSLGGECVAPG